MDKKNVIIGLGCIIAAFGLMFYQSKQQLDQQTIEPAPEVVESGETVESSSPPAGGLDSLDATDAPSPVVTGEAAEEVFRPVVEEEIVEQKVIENEPAVVSTLSNEFIKVDFTTRGGAIEKIYFLQTKRGGLDTFVFNAGGGIPALGLSFQGPASKASYNRPYRLVEEETTDSQIVYERALGGGIVVRRSYTIAAAGDPEADPYMISHTTELINQSGQALQSGSGASVELGTVYSLGDDSRGEFLNFGYFDGEDTEFLGKKVFQGSSGILGIGARTATPEVEESVTNLEWGVIKNQFFAFVATVGEGLLSNGFYATMDQVEPADPVDGEGLVDAVRGSLNFPITRIDPGDRQVIDIQYYAGPKEFNRLTKLGENQDEVMQFGFFGFFSKILMFFLYAIHSFIPSWGWSIVVMTIIIKLCFWPLTAKAAASQKRMRKIQEPLKEIREKFKDSPQKMQKETMRLFRENKVNPAAGCLPILIQMPIFFGLFWMLRTASELRYAPFLWINDLSQPDTVAHIFDFPINILPLIMGATMYFQMQMTPAMASADAMQQKIFKFLPFIFLIFLYNFSSGLVLYWTVQNLLTILQQYITNKRDDVANEPVVIPGSNKKKKRAGKK